MKKKEMKSLNIGDNTYEIVDESARKDIEVLKKENIDRQTEIAVERARINQFTTLEEGSTTGDAELMNIRIGADGKTYSSAGEAVRTQIKELSDDINYINPALFENLIDDATVSVYRNFPYTSDVKDVESVVNVSECDTNGTSCGQYLEVEVLSGHNYLMLMKAMVKQLDTGDNSGLVTITKGSGTGNITSVYSIIGLVDGVQYLGQTPSVSNITLNQWYTLGVVYTPIVDEKFKVRTMFNISSNGNKDTVYAFKDIMVVDVGDELTSEVFSDILNIGYFEKKYTTFGNKTIKESFDAIQEEVNALEESFDAIQEEVDALEESLNKLPLAKLTLENLFKDSTNEDGVAHFKNINGLAASYKLLVDFSGIINISMYAKASNAVIANNNYSAYIYVWWYDDADKRISISHYAPIVSTEYKLYEYHFAIPQGAKYGIIRLETNCETDIYIKEFHAEQKSHVVNHTNGVHFDCHLGLGNAPMNTMEGFSMARIAGFNSLIFNLRSTSDGVLVCMHDDDIALYSNGTGNCSEMTYEQLLEYDFSFTKNLKDSKGAMMNPHYTSKICTVNEVLRFCSINGITPVFRLDSHTIDDYNNILSMLRKYNLYGKARCKAFSHSILQTAYDVVGNGFYSYSIEYNGAFDAEKVALLKSKSYYNEQSFIEGTASALTEEVINYALSENVSVGVASIGSMSVIYDLICKGVTYITSDVIDGCPLIY